MPDYTDTDGEEDIYILYQITEDQLKDVMKFFVGQLRQHDNQECKAILERFKDTSYGRIFASYGFVI